MSNFDAEYIYSLYNPDNGVELYDSLEEAESARCQWLKVVPVEGPFKHSRPEKDLILAIKRTLSTLIDACENDVVLAKEQRLNSVVTELQRTLDRMSIPF